MVPQSGSNMEEIRVMNPQGSLLCQLKTTWLCEPDNNLRTRYIQDRPSSNPAPRPRVKHAVWKTSPRRLLVPRNWYQKGQHSSEKTKELLWRLEWNRRGAEQRALRHFSLERTCSSVGFCSMMRTSSVSM